MRNHFGDALYADHVSPLRPRGALRASRGGLPPRDQCRVFLVLVGTIAYTLAEGWHVVDAFYFAVAR
jgi:hypothetical protein